MAPTCFDPKSSAVSVGKAPQCAPSAPPTVATATNTPKGVGFDAAIATPSATATCAAAKQVTRETRNLRNRNSEASPPIIRPRQLHTENTETSADEAASFEPTAEETWSRLFTSAIAAPEEPEMVANNNHCSGARNDSSNVRSTRFWPIRGGGGWSSVETRASPTAEVSPSSSRAPCVSAPVGEKRSGAVVESSDSTARVSSRRASTSASPLPLASRRER
mmetsp:Transcript_15089/g.63660  ORF Transcript_15089/g.63660 Transcript_15089/m.63660 type:complete len:220 (+) Transcript_15089:366-1025(+)